jgi:hypothetical protein
MNSDYITDKDGNRILSPEAQKQRTINYLQQLYPMEWSDKPKKIDWLVNYIKSECNLDEPTMFICNDDIHKTVFASILKLFGVFYHWSETHIDHGTQNFLDGEFHDVSSEYDGSYILFVNMNFGETKNMLHPQIARNYAINRKMRGLKTFFFFWGTRQQLDMPKWIDDETGDHLSKYIKIIDLNKKIKINKEANR